MVKWYEYIDRVKNPEEFKPKRKEKGKIKKKDGPGVHDKTRVNEATPGPNNVKGVKSLSD